MTSINAGKFTLQPLTIDFIDNRYLHWMNDLKVTQWLDSNQIEKKDMNYLKGYVQSFDNVTNFLFGIYHDRKLIGTHAFRYDVKSNHASVGTMIGDSDYWGKGVPLVTRAAILDWCFSKFDLDQIYGGSHSKNFPSIYNFKRQGWAVKKITKKHRIVGDIDIDMITFVMTKDKWHEFRQS